MLTNENAPSFILNIGPYFSNPFIKSSFATFSFQKIGKLNRLSINGRGLGPGMAENGFAFAKSSVILSGFAAVDAWQACKNPSSVGKWLNCTRYLQPWGIRKKL